MASTNETGHAKNVANFLELLGFCIGYGPDYNPTKAALKLPTLQTLHISAAKSIEALDFANTALDNATNDREIAFAPLKKLVTRIVNALSATDAMPQTVDDANKASFKIQGRRASAKVAPTPAKDGQPAKESTSISTSQQSFDNQVANFAKLIQTLSAEPLYVPNETDLQVASLNVLHTDLKNKNADVVTATTAASNALIERNKILYDKTTGLCATALAVKKYVKSVFDATNPKFLQDRKSVV